MSHSPPPNRSQQQPQASRPPHPNYPAGQARPVYYIDDAEGYVGDYSESDGLSDSGQPQRGPRLHPPSDVTEIYRRKPASAPPMTAYRQGVYLPPEYYYEQAPPIPPPVRMMQASPPPQMYQKRMPMPPQPPLQPREKFYSGEEMTYQHHPPSMYHPSLPQLATQTRQNTLHRTPSATMMRQQQMQMQHQIQQQQQRSQQQPPPQMMKRHPVTVRTPRYVRRPATIYKKPSALCLPIACQPDPAMYRRVRRVVPPEGNVYHPPPQEPIMRRHSMPAPISVTPNKPKKVESRKSLDMTKNRLDSILERYENLLGKTSEDNVVVSDQEIAQHLKPRIPPSLKEKQKIPKITRQQIPEIMKNAETFEVEEITSEVLDELLSELTEHGFRDVMNIDDSQNEQILKANNRVKTHGNIIPDTKLVVGKCDAELTATAKNSQIDVPVKDIPKSFNYQEIKDSLGKINHMTDYNSESDDGKSQRVQHLKKLEPSSNISRTVSKVGSKLNAHDAMELHRTKSYVVNLIDTALSSHFGTNVCEKSSNKEYMDPKSAVEMLKKHSSGKMDKELCLEIAQVLTDSFVSSSTAPNCPKTSSECTCKTQLEEPTFVKQLKQMRWGHLKHIQREVRRLEDLERFLDSCSVSSFEKYTNH